jgi:transposase
MGKIERIEVPPEDRERLERLVRDRNTPQKIVWRSQIVLLAGEGIGAVEVATRVGKSVLSVRRWRRRYAAKGVDGLLKDATRPPARAQAADGEENQSSREPDAQREATSPLPR